MTALSRRSFFSTSLAGLAVSQSFNWLDPQSILLAAESDQRPDTLFLTWQRDPTTTMTIQWIGRPAGDSPVAVHYAPDQPEASWKAQSASIKPYPLSDLSVFRVELTGLTPGSEYQFKVGNSTAIHRFRTMPARATDTIHFISGGDCGVNEHAVNNNKLAARQDPSFAVIGGDLGYDNGRSLDVSLNFIRNYSQQMVTASGRLIPMIPCIGNHEVDGGYGTSRKKAPFYYALFDGLYPETGYNTLDFGDYLSLVLLDTGHTSMIGGEQTDWLERTLKDRRDHPHVMVVNHVPAYPSYRVGTAGAENRKHWVPLFEKHRVPVVLEHHDHTFKRSKPLLDGLVDRRGVLYLGDGSWGKLRTPQTPEQLPHLAVTSGEYHLSLHRIEGEERFHLGLSEHGRVMDVCRTAQRPGGA